MAETHHIEKITIIFPPGDQLTSLLVQKEANTKLEELLNRLCTLRAIELDLKKLAVLNDVGKDIDLNQTVAESGLYYVEIVDKKKKGEKEKKNKEKDPVHKPPPPAAKPVLGQLCYLSLDEQLLDEEKKALVEIKKSHHDLCENFTDEYIACCLITRKLEIDRAVELLNAAIQFRKENGFETLPKFSDINPEFFEIWYVHPGARDKIGRSLRYGRGGQINCNVEPFTIPNLRKYFAWMFFVGMYADGFDAIRAGVHLVNDLEGASWKKFDLEFFRALAKMVSGTFPEFMRKFEIVNPPSIFNAINTIMKTVLPKKMTDRMSVVTDKKKLFKHSDVDNLLDIYGGKIPYVKGKWHAHLQEWAEKKEQHLLKPLKH